MSVRLVWRRLCPWLVLASILFILFGGGDKRAAWFVLAGVSFVQLVGDWRRCAEDFALDDAIDMAEHFVRTVVLVLGYLWLLQAGSSFVQ